MFLFTQVYIKWVLALDKSAGGIKPCDGQVSHPGRGGSHYCNIPRHFMLWKPVLNASLMGQLAHKLTFNLPRSSTLSSCSSHSLKELASFSL